MIEQQPPELADGGYWYVVDAPIDPVHGGRVTPGIVIKPGWCAWYFGDRGIIRCPSPITVLEALKEPPSKSFVGKKPRGRVGGK